MTIYHRTDINCCIGNPLIAFQSTVTFDGTDYYSYLRDYQGNIRCVVRPVGRADFEMVQQNHYYPYGLPVSCSTSPDANPYKYGSKHLDTRLIDVVALLRKDRLNLYDFEARLHAPDLARFLSPDPHASDYRDLSPYIFCAANPIRNIDPTGKYFVDTKGHRIDYNPSTGQWSANATADVKRYAGYLSKTKIGRTILKNILSSDIKTSVKFNQHATPSNGTQIYGSTDMTFFQNNRTKKLHDFKAVININENIIVEETYIYRQDGKTSSTELGRKRFELKPTEDELIETVCVHEGVHATDKKDLVPRNDFEREKRAVEAEIQAIKEVMDRKATNSNE